MSKRIGLRTMGSIGAKKALVCPSGEQIVNGGFETGDFTGWEVTGEAYVVSWAPPHSGSYFAAIYSYEHGIKQDIQSLKGYTIPVICIKTFRVWLHGPTCPKEAGSIITYSDDSTQLITFEVGDEWVECDLLPYLNNAKAVKSIEIIYGPDLWVDDVSLIC